MAEVDPFTPLEMALAAAREAWCAASATAPAVDGVSGVALIAANDAVSALRHEVDALHSRIAAQISRASRSELGNAGLAKQQGFRTPAALIAASIGSSTGDAARLIAVGDATAPRPTLTGDEAPARHPEVAAALGSGLSMNAAAAIIALLDRVALRAGHDAIEEAERVLVAQAVGLSLEKLQKVLQRAEAWLDPDGVVPREDELRSGRFLRLHEERDGYIVLTAKLDPETAAPVKTAIEAIVSVHLRSGACSTGSVGAERASSLEQSGLEQHNVEQRSIVQLQADALATICRHLLGCEAADAPTAGATVVVRVGLEQLQAGTGHATIDGITQPVSVATARRMAADGAIIPCVLGGDSAVLDFGRSRRRFSTAQKLVLTERDGGCSKCGLPPGMTQVHHVRWWTRDAGPTDLDCGVLLCVRCHHQIHDDGWNIRVDGVGLNARVWFTPPAHVDPRRTPQLGGRARFDYLSGAA